MERSNGSGTPSNPLDCPLFWRQRQEALAGLQPGEPLYAADHQKILDLSYTSRINEALDSEGEVQHIWDAEQPVSDVSMDELDEIDGDSDSARGGIILPMNPDPDSTSEGDGEIDEPQEMKVSSEDVF